VQVSEHQAHAWCDMCPMYFAVPRRLENIQRGKLLLYISGPAKQSCQVGDIYIFLKVGLNVLLLRLNGSYAN